MVMPVGKSAGASHEILHATAEIAIGTTSGGVALAYWLRFLQEMNIVLATCSLLLGVCVGFHGVWRIWRSYGNRR